MTHPAPRLPLPRRASALAMLVTMGACSPAAQPDTLPSVPDLVLLNGKVFTADPERPWAEAVAVGGERILAVGTTAEIEDLAGPSTRRIALEGRTVVPGFDDAHAHVGHNPIPGIDLKTDLSPTPDPRLQVILDSLASAASRTPPGTWLSSYVGELVLDDPHATRAALDSVAPAHPVWLGGWSGHGTILNSAALRISGLLDAPDPTGGWLARDGSGAPMGRVDEYAIYGAQRRMIIAGGDSLLANAMQSYSERSLRLGITSVQDMAVIYDLNLARSVVERGGTMSVRHRTVQFPLDQDPGNAASWRVTGTDTILAPMWHVSGEKWILDGTPVERLALMRRPYADRPGWYGHSNFTLEQLRTILRDALAHRNQPMLHAVGDSMIALVITAMRAEAPDSAWRSLRPRLEHADGLGRDQLADLKALGIVVVQNPSHVALPEMMTTRWGAERLRGVNMLRTLIDSGVPLALGSDGPLEPGLNIMFATLHPDVPSEALTREQAVTAYTRGAAYAAFAERERGTLAPGMLADLAVLSQDIFTVAPDALPATMSVLTMVGGRVAHDELNGAMPR